MSASSVVSKLSGGASAAAATVTGGASTLTSGLESAAFTTQIQTVQNQANEAALANAITSNGKALVDALAKNIKGTGDSIKQAGAQ